MGFLKGRGNPPLLGGRGHEGGSFLEKKIFDPAPRGGAIRVQKKKPLTDLPKIDRIRPEMTQNDPQGGVDEESRD